MTDTIPSPLDASGAPARRRSRPPSPVPPEAPVLPGEGEADLDRISRLSDRLRVLAESSRRLLTSDEPESVVQSICESVMVQLDCHVFFNYLIEDGTQHMRLNAYAGISPRAAAKIAHLDFGVAVCGCAARDGCRIVAEDIPNTPDPRTDLVASYGVLAYACHPLVYRGVTIGTLSFGTRSRTTFSADDLELMRLVADQAALAMARTRETEERARLDLALDDVRTAVASTLHTGEIVDRVIEGSAPALCTGSATFILRRGEGWETVLVRGNLPHACVGRTADDSSAPMVAAAAEERRGIVALGQFDEPLFACHGDLSSTLLVPLVMQGRPFGVVAFHRDAGAPAFSEPEVGFAARLINVASCALDNAAAYHREHTIAEALQDSILAKPEPVAGVEYSLLYRPASDTARVGGDFYDVFALDRTHAGIVIGDASGKGLEAARLTSLLRDGIRAYAYEHGSLALTMRLVNDLVLRMSPVQEFATVFFGILDVSTGELQYSGAAHPGGVIVGDRGIVPLESTRAAMIGAFANADLGSSVVRLEPGDTLVLYTDGLTEARRGDGVFGGDGVMRLLDRERKLPVAEIPAALVDEATAFAGGTTRDDIVVLCVRWSGPASTTRDATSPRSAAVR